MYHPIFRVLSCTSAVYCLFTTQLRPCVGEMEEFDGFLNHSDLFELRVQGSWFTWTSKPRGLPELTRRLDKVLANNMRLILCLCVRFVLLGGEFFIISL